MDDYIPILQDSIEPTQQPIMPPPPGTGTFDDIQSLIDAVNKHAGPNGYAVVKARSKRHKTHGYVNRVYLACDRSGKENKRNIDLIRKRLTSSRMCECPFSIVASYDSLQWIYTVRDSTHNHPPSGYQGAHPALRHLTPEALDTIRRQTLAGSSAREVVSVLRLEDSTAYIKAKDVSNAKNLIRRKEIGPMTPTQALMLQLNKRDDFFMEFVKDNNNRLTHLFIVYEKSRNLLRQNPDVLIIDSTYKTNVYGMPLVNILGVTTLGTTFYVGFAFIVGETMDDYAWVMQCLKKLYDLIQVGYI